MNRRGLVLVTLAALTWGWAVLAGGPLACAPLLFVRVQGPPTMVVTFHDTPSRDFPAPVVVGMRPGYRHRLTFSNLADVGGGRLHATLEVYDTLRLPPRQKAADFPAPVVLDELDLRRAAVGAMITKVLVIEDPEKVRTVPGANGEPGVVLVAPEEDLFRQARDLGRIVATLRIGGREPDVYELRRQVPGLILYPDMAMLPPAPCPPLPNPFAPPWFPCQDGQECLHDGGDENRRMHFNARGEVDGIDPADALAEYTDSKGRKHFKPTNRVCLCVPRFVVARQDLPLGVIDGVHEPGDVRQGEMGLPLSGRQERRRYVQIDETVIRRGRQGLQQNITIDRARPIIDLQVLGAVDLPLGPFALLGTDQMVKLTDIDRTRMLRQIDLATLLSKRQRPEGTRGEEGVRAVGRIDEIGQVQGVLETRTVVFCCDHAPEVPEQPLLLCKWVSTDAAKIGDTVTFTIRYSNVGGKPIRDIAIVDSLTARLEYVPGTAKSDRDAVFVTQDNEAGSLQLRWEIKDPLPPGQKGSVSFQAKIK